jgi:hypothetical protein
MTTAGELKKFIQENQKKLAAQGIFLPVKTDTGIEIGPVSIRSQETIKNIYVYDELRYSDISLNVVAISLSKMLLLKSSHIDMDRLWKSDQEYGKYLTECQFLLYTYRKALDSKDFDRADGVLARYEIAKSKAAAAKTKAQALCIK